MKKIDRDIVLNAFSKEGNLEEYSKATINIELWASEKRIFPKYIKKDDKILDIGCGAGRTTFAMYKLGYHNIIGLDLSQAMINEAININASRDCNIDFIVGDATSLKFSDNMFDSVIFSYNGLMQIPMLENRLKAFKEISRVIKYGGYFIFTTHDMEIDPSGIYFWREERIRWKKGIQNPRLAEFGDLIYKQHGCEMFIHVPTRDEILNCLDESGLILVEDRFRPDICEESEAVKLFSDECRFWVVKKP